MAVAVVIVAERCHRLELLTELEDIGEREAMHPDLLWIGLGELGLGVTVEARVVGRILRVRQAFAIVVEGTAVGLYVRRIVARVGGTIEQGSAVGEAEMILPRA